MSSLSSAGAHLCNTDRAADIWEMTAEVVQPSFPFTMDSVWAHFLTPKRQKHTGQLTHTHTHMQSCITHNAVWFLTERTSFHQSLSITPPFLFMFSTFQSPLDVIVLLPSELARATCHPFCNLTKCGFHLPDMVWICPPSRTAFPLCEVHGVIQMHAGLQRDCLFGELALTLSQQPPSQVHRKL